MAATVHLTDLMDVALGSRPADVIVRGGRVVNLFLATVEQADVLIADGRVAGLVDPGTATAGDATQVVDADGSYVCPGLIDAHFHMGGSHLPVAELARALLARGTTAIATDLYEIYTVGGPPGVRAALDEAAEARLKLLFLPPVHLLGLEGYGTFGWDVSAADMAEMLAWDEAVGIMEPPAAVVLARHPGVLDLVADTTRRRKTFAGHAPGMTGRDLQAYLAVGASSDHESRTAEEALAKLRRGMRTMMRQGSAAPDLPALIEMARDHPASTRWMMLCSDEVDPADLSAHGHMDTKVRMAVAAGVDPVVALQMSSLNTAEYFGAGHLGAVAPGRAADLVLVDDLRAFRPRLVLSDGVVVARDGVPVAQAAPRDPAPSLRSHIRVPRPLRPADFPLPAPAGSGDGAVVAARVIGVEDGSLVSLPLRRDLPVRDGVVAAAPQDDVLHIAVVERHRATGRIGRAFTSGFGFRSGAVAMTYCHVYHNMLVVGATPEAMAAAANVLRELGGGIVVVDGDGGVTASWALPIVGVIGDQPLDAAQPAFQAVNDAIRDLGCPLTSPVLALSFVALPTIPAYGLTDRGLYDVAADAFVDVVDVVDPT
jgi:adenine deaminase